MDVSMMGKLLAVFVGSGLGGVCRWGVSQVCQASWPAGTLVVNVVGCFLLGLLNRMMPGSEQVRLLLMTGFCGGFTTFSTFMNEGASLMKNEHYTYMMLYLFGSLALGLIAVLVGHQLAKL